MKKRKKPMPSSRLIFSMRETQDKKVEFIIAKGTDLSQAIWAMVRAMRMEGSPALNIVMSALIHQLSTLEKEVSDKVIHDIADLVEKRRGDLPVAVPENNDKI